MPDDSRSLRSSLPAAARAVLAGPYRWEARTESGVEVPGLDEALRVPGAPADLRLLLATISAGMGSTTEGVRDGVGNRRRRVVMDATPDQPARECVVVETAGRAWWSRGGSRFGPLQDPRSPLESEAALDALLEAVPRDPPRTEGDALVLDLDASVLAEVIDLEAIGASDQGSHVRGRLTVRPADGGVEAVLVVEVGATETATGMGGLLRSTTTARYWSDPDATVEVPVTSLAMPSMRTVGQALRVRERSPRPARRRRR